MKWARRHWLELVLAVLLALPWLSLFLLGFLWLWQNGRTLEWALAAASLGLVGWPLRVFAQRRARARIAQGLATGDFSEEGRNTEESEAWAKVLRFAETTPALALDDRDGAEALMRETVELVALHFHPDRPDAITRVTLPEALLLTEQVASRLRRWVVTLPGASRIRISDALWLQDMVDRHGKTAMAIYNIGETIYRIGRAAVNPVQAVAQEAQRVVAGTTGSFIGGNMRRKLTSKLIQETGRAAIDLYSGRLRLSSLELAELARADAAAAEPEVPPRLLLVGQAHAGKTSLLNALAGVARGHVGGMPSAGPVREHLVTVEGKPALNIADMPALADPAAFLREAERADMILWVAAATQPGRGPDATALEALRNWAGDQRRTRPPPLLVAMTQSDRLRPTAEWAPPYDPDNPKSRKEESIRAARDAIAALLLVPEDAVVPVALPEGLPAWNVEPLWARIQKELDAARRTRNERLRDAVGKESFRTEAGRAWRSGAAFVKNVWRA